MRRWNDVRLVGSEMLRPQPPTQRSVLSQRLSYIRGVRLSIALLVVIDGLLLPSLLRCSRLDLLAVSCGYLLVLFAIEWVRQLRDRHPLGWVNLALAADSAYLIVATYLAGGGTSPVRYLAFIYIAAVTLLGDYRHGVQVAIVQTALQVAVFFGQKSDVLAAFTAPVATEWHWLVALILALWAFTATVATLAAAGEGELRRRRFELERLAQLGHRLEDATDGFSVGEVLLETLAETFAYHRMVLVNLVGDSLHLLASYGPIVSADEEAELDLPEDSILRRASETRTSITAPCIDPAGDPWLAATLPHDAQIVVVPLVADRVVGILVVEAPSGARGLIGRRVVATTERFAAQAALAIRNAFLLERLKRIALTDGLTELANRREFDRALERELARAARSDGRLSIVLLDIDHFKAVNDTHGHLVGDAVLQEVANALRQCGRDYDTIARYGGEEFAVVLPGCSAGMALRVAERLRAAVESASSEVAVTASCGVATYPVDGDDAAQLLIAADRAMYAAKRAGRNQVRAADATEDAEVSAAG